MASSTMPARCRGSDWGMTVEEDVRQVLDRYCRGVDRIDLDIVRGYYHPDATDDHGAFKGGVEPFLEWIGRLLPRYGVTTHSLTNILVEHHPTRDDVVRVETYWGGRPPDSWAGRRS